MKNNENILDSKEKPTDPKLNLSEEAPQKSVSDVMEVDDSIIVSKKTNEDNTRFGDWVINGRAIDF